MDNNTRSLCLSCPLFHKDGMLRTFVEDPHYTLSDRSNIQFVSSWKEIHRELNLHQFFQWPGIPSIVTPYTLCKNKDLLKLRPVVPYSIHPLKMMLNVTSRAISHMLNNSSLTSFTMFNTADFPELVSQVNKRLDALPGTEVHVRSGDV
jgi:hypothetical protein